MIEFIPANMVRIGTQLFIEYAPSREDTFEVLAVNNRGQEIDFRVRRLGWMRGYRHNENVAVER